VVKFLPLHYTRVRVFVNIVVNQSRSHLTSYTPVVPARRVVAVDCAILALPTTFAPQQRLRTPFIIYIQTSSTVYTVKIDEAWLVTFNIDLLTSAWHCKLGMQSVITNTRIFRYTNNNIPYCATSLRTCSSIDTINPRQSLSHIVYHHCEISELTELTVLTERNLRTLLIVSPFTRIGD